MMLLACLASAQSRTYLPPTLTASQQGLKPTGVAPKLAPPGYVPAWCGACLFYGGDGDPASSNADGLWNNNSADFGINGQVYSPFIVPKKTDKCGGSCSWIVSGLVVNLQMSLDPRVTKPTDAVWAIYQGLAEGGTPATATVVCSGTDTNPTFTPTGRVYFGLYEYAMAVSVPSDACPRLTGDKDGIMYWQQVTPEYGATGAFQLSYESNVPDSPPPNAVGEPEPVDQSFFYGPAFGYSAFTAAQTVGTKFHVFSAAVQGTLGKKK